MIETSKKAVLNGVVETFKIAWNHLSEFDRWFVCLGSDLAGPV
jgi:hypothetical protein